MPRAIRNLLLLTFEIRLLVVCLCVCATSATARASSTEPPERLGEACENKKAASCLALGLLYEQGQAGVAKDESHAARLYSQACRGGSAPACDKLGELYEEGRGVNEDARHAASLYEQACTGGVARGCNNLGILYQDGRGTPKDEQRAAGMYEQACTAGYPNACTNLGLLYLRGSGVAKDERRAVTLFEKSCGAGRADACSHLATLYGTGHGVAKDEHRAASFAQKACVLGDDGSCLRFRSPRSVKTVEKVEEPKPLWDQGTRLRLIFTLGGQVGGDTLLEATFTDGSTEKLRAGDAMLFAAGGVLEPFGGTTHLLQLQATGGYNLSYLGADNAGVYWKRLSWELLAFYAYRPLDVRLGGGVQYSMGISLEGDGGLSAYSTSFENVAGWVAQADWHSDFFSVYARYTRIAYTPVGYAPVGVSAAVPANSFGLGVSLLLRVL